MGQGGRLFFFFFLPTLPNGWNNVGSEYGRPGGSRHGQSSVWNDGWGTGQYLRGRKNQHNLAGALSAFLCVCVCVCVCVFVCLSVCVCVRGRRFEVAAAAAGVGAAAFAGAAIFMGSYICGL